MKYRSLSGALLGNVGINISSKLEKVFMPLSCVALFIVLGA